MTYTPEQLRELIEALRNGAPLPSDEAIALATAHASALDKLKVAEEALVRCEDATAYASHEDSCGYRVCCQVRSYKPHAPGCYLAAALAEIRGK